MPSEYVELHVHIWCDESVPDWVPDWLPWGAASWMWVVTPTPDLPMGNSGAVNALKVTDFGFASCKRSALKEAKRVCRDEAEKVKGPTNPESRKGYEKLTYNAEVEREWTIKGYPDDAIFDD